VARAGHRIVWSEEALVHEWIPESRTRVGWLLRRSFRMGITTTQREREQYATPTRAALRLLRRTARFGQEVLRLPLALLRGRGATMKALQDICYRAGDLAGMTGVRYEEYRTTHGG
jgi:succinoglycan biosynthesis protein ExoM